MITVGSYLMLLVVAHFIGDWLLQPHQMAITKTKDKNVRAVHCSIYTFVIVLMCLAITTNPIALFASAIFTFSSHFFIDSYKPLMWFRKIMKDPYAQTPEEFEARFQTPIGSIVYITIDQIFHLLCLLIVAIILVL